MANKSQSGFSSTQVLAESAVMVALSIALFAVSEIIPWPSWLQGGGITLFGQVPIVVLSYRHGIKAGLPAALVLGIFELIMGLSNFGYVKGAVSYLVVALFDYLLAYGLLGLGGIFRKAFEKKESFRARQVPALALGSVFACALRFLCHFLSGVTVWSEYTQSGGGFTNLDSLIHGITKASVIYSVTYNGGYMLPETIITVVGAVAVGSLLDLSKKRVSR